MMTSKRKKSKRQPSQCRLLVHDPKVMHIPRVMGGGLIKEYAEIDMDSGRLWRYSLVYVNPMIHSHDNGRVLGYDNAHGRPHRHFMGEITPEPDLPWDQVSEKFHREWKAIAKHFMEGDT